MKNFGTFFVVTFFLYFGQITADVKPPETFETKSLTLRHPVESDMQIVFDKYTSVLVVSTYLPWAPHTNIDQTIQRYLIEQGKDGLFCWVIHEKTTGNFVGMATMAVKQEEASSKYEIFVACGFIPDTWGNGYAKELLQFGIEWFKKSDVQKLCTTTHRENSYMINILNASEMVLEATDVSTKVAGDTLENRLYYSIEKEATE